MNEQLKTYRHPEWKRLYDTLAGQLKPDQLWSYATLSEMAGIDIRSTRGRTQFYRCQREVLKNHGWWLANVPREGYRVIHPNSQPRTAVHIVKMGLRKTKRGFDVNAYAKVELMAADMARASADLQTRHAVFAQQAANLVKEARKVIGAAEPKRLPSPLLDKAAG